MKRKDVQRLLDLADYTRLASIRVYDIVNAVLEDHATSRMTPDEIETVNKQIEAAYIHAGEMRDIIGKS